METPPNLRIGTAGWSYKDWEGIVYPVGHKRAQHPVEYLARYIDAIEINTSFYGHIRPELGKLWCRKAAGVNPDFLFTAKLNRAFTHSPNAQVEPTSAATIRPGPDDEALAKEGLDAIVGEGRLGALLAQFPVSFKNTGDNRDYLEQLLPRFHEYPLVVEVRHASWNNEGILRYLAQKGGLLQHRPAADRALAGAHRPRHFRPRLHPSARPPLRPVVRGRAPPRPLRLPLPAGRAGGLEGEDPGGRGQNQDYLRGRQQPL